MLCCMLEQTLTMLVLLVQSQWTSSMRPPLPTGRGAADLSVTFENPNPCALKGSSVELSCSYHPPDGETVYKTAWYKGELRNGTWRRVALSDLPSHHNRSEYIGDHQHDCRLAIHGLQEDDTGYYYFRFDTERHGIKSKGSVHLTVTELEARVSSGRVRAGHRVTLTCQTSCQLSTTVWFRDGRRVANTEFQAQAEDAGNYTCAFEGQESVLSDPVALLVQYPPVNVSVEVSYPGHLAEGVSLSCSSAANPAADYTWYSSTGSRSSSMLLLGSGQVLSVHSVQVSHTGLYLCQATNPLGESNSTQVLLKVEETDAFPLHRVILYTGIGLKVLLLLLLPLVMIWAWRQRPNPAVDKEDNNYENISI